MNIYKGHGKQIVRVRIDSYSRHNWLRFMAGTEFRESSSSVIFSDWRAAVL